jgi:trk system potassium uptake protein TrkA
MIDELPDDLDCSFPQGDGSRSDILREVNPEETDELLGLADDDKDNLIAALVGRSLGF